MLTVLVDTVLSALDKQWWTGRERVRLPPARVVLPKRGMCRRHGGATNITETLEQLLLDFTDGFRDTGIEKGHATKNWSSTQTTRSMIESGRRSSSTDRKMKNVGICSTLNGNSALSVQHRMKHARGTYRQWHKLLCRQWHKVLCCPCSPLKLTKEHWQTQCGQA